MENLQMTMPSGKNVSKLDVATPGQSLTKPMGEQRWEHAPQYTTATDSLAYIMTKIGNVDAISRLIAALQEGITVRSIVQALILTSFAEGKFNPSIAELIKDDLTTFIQIIAEKAGIEYTMGSKKNEDSFYDDLENLKSKHEEVADQVNPQKKELVDQGEKEFVEQEPTPKGLMVKDTSNSLMSRGV